jgi:putative phosphoribosyl transferase
MFKVLTRKFQFKYKNRVTAANILGQTLKNTIKEDIPGVIVLGIPRGGVVTADIVAKKISAPEFDIVVPRKLTDPDNKEQAIGAIMADGTTYIDEQLMLELKVSSEYLKQEKIHQIEEIKRRTLLFVGNHTTRKYNFENKTVILVDDGAATGATLIVAARSIRKKFRLNRLIIALPIAPKNTVKLLKQECDLVKVIISPSSNFRTVEQYYQDFSQVMDEQVIQIMRSRKL